MSYAEPVKLLVVEDDSDQLELIGETLEDHFGRGCVMEASSMAEALRQDIAGFDMILCDYNLPDGSGLDLLDQVVNRFSTPIIMVTGENVGAIAAESIRRGACDYVVKVGDYLYTIPVVVEKNLAVAKIKRENEHLRVELENTLGELREKNGQLEESLRRVEELAATDPLTSLYNRRHFGRVLDQLFAEAQRYDKELSCVMIDLDNYKQLNDTYGHQVGDQILVLAGKVIQSNLRRMDAAVRYGGDEFVLLLPHADGTEAARVVQRIREEFETATAPLLKRATGVSMSVGIACSRSQRPAHAEQLVSAADVALYQAKGSGRGRTVVSASAATTRAVGA